MRCIIVSDTHISAMLSMAAPRYEGDKGVYYWRGRYYSSVGHIAQIGRILQLENVRSYNYKHSDHVADNFIYRPRAPSLTALGAIKAINGYIYHSGGMPDWKETEAFAIAYWLLDRAIHKLPGMDEVRTWNIPDPQ